jgi:hypothetical protein
MVDLSGSFQNVALTAATRVPSHLQVGYFSIKQQLN